MYKYIEISDLFLLKLFNQSIKCKTLDVLMPLLTRLGSAGFSIIYSLLIFIFLKAPKTLTSYHCAISIILSTIIVQILKRKILRIRPFETSLNLYINKIQIDKYSFPSGHTAAAFSIAVSTILLFPSLTVSCLLLAFTVALSRMYLGVHYPSDVFAGILIGTVCPIVVYMTLNLLSI